MKARKNYITRSPIKRRKRPESKTTRIYGPPARRKFVSEMACAACGVVGFSENAHLAPAGEKGTGFKAGYRFIVPLCGMRPIPWRSWQRAVISGCHQLYDEHREEFVRRFPSFDPSLECERTEQKWQEQLQNQER